MLPDLAGLQRDLEADPAVGIHRHRTATARDRDGAVKILVAVAVGEALVRIGPLAGNTAAPHDVLGLDLEHVGEIASHDDLEIKPHRLLVVIGELEILADAAVDAAVDHEAERLGRNIGLLGRDRAIGQVDARQEVRGRAAVQQVPPHAVRVERPGTDHPRVEEIQSHGGRPGNLAIRLGDQHRIALVDGKLRRTDFDFERHGRASLRNCCADQTRQDAALQANRNGRLPGRGKPPARQPNLVRPGRSSATTRSCSSVPRWAPGRRETGGRGGRRTCCNALRSGS